MTVKTINDLAGLNSIILILLVFSVYLWFIKINPPCFLVIKRTKVIYIITKKVCRFYTVKQVKNTLVIRNSLNIKKYTRLAFLVRYVCLT
jgi:hypothetical protein